jgi:LmbE family N-acetylglucosaminyl deacetylase
MKNKDKIKNISIILIILVFILLIFKITYDYNNKPYKIDKDFTKIDLNDYDNLMIIAHPKDELLWGGANILKDNYLVVCITCGNDKTRVNEFIKVMKKTNDKYIILGYPEENNGRRDNWETSKDNITKDLDKILKLKKWNKIVTHNPLGEYGHFHHKETSSIVTNLLTNKDKLYYFGKYYNKKTIHKYTNQLIEIDEEYIIPKKSLLGIYKSQDYIQTSFNHMFNYEEWVSYEKWGEE